MKGCQGGRPVELRHRRLHSGRSASIETHLAGSLLQSAGLDDLIASSLEEYEALALKLAQASPRSSSVSPWLQSPRAVRRLHPSEQALFHSDSSAGTLAYGCRRICGRHHGAGTEAHVSACTLDEVLRPQTKSIRPFLLSLREHIEFPFELDNNTAVHRWRI